MLGRKGAKEQSLVMNVTEAKIRQSKRRKRKEPGKYKVVGRSDLYLERRVMLAPKAWKLERKKGAAGGKWHQAGKLEFTRTSEARNNIRKAQSLRN
jgi:hypothetical protein